MTRLCTILILVYWIPISASQIHFPTHNPRKDLCKTSLGLEGKCVNFGACDVSVEPTFPNSCGFSTYKPRICCPIRERIGEIKLREVSPPTVDFECGMRVPTEVPLRRRRRSARRIPDFDYYLPPHNLEDYLVEGVEVVQNSWPWMALLGRKQGPKIKFFCGGSLINHEYVITAAHCAEDLAPFFVRLGEHEINVAVHESNALHEDVDVENVIFHPRYDVNKGYYDVALLKLVTPVKFRREVRPVCLPWRKLGTEDLVGKRVYITGWGATKFGGELSTVLREIQTTVFGTELCDKSYSTLPTYSQTFPNGINKKNMVCAGDSAWEKDSCNGDSGGPMVLSNSEFGPFNLAGIISKGFGCAKEDFPGLYAPIRHRETLQWIKDVAFSNVA